MTMREHDRLHPIPVFDQIRNIGNNNVYTQQFGLGEHQTSVDDDDVVAPANGHAIHAELAHPPKGYDV